MSVLSLNEPQREAVNHRQGYVVVFASAGSGKTRIITARLARLLDSGVPARNILAVTFTNRAAKEMRERAQKLAPSAKHCLISTFHSACARWLREFADEIGLNSNFIIYDQKDSLNALKTVISSMRIELSEKTPVTDFSSAISRAKTAGVFADETDKLAQYYPELIFEGGFNLYKHYQTFLRNCNAVDFGDLILYIVSLLRDNDRVRHSLQRRFKYIMVDEYQDINGCQFELVRTLAEGHNNLLVVGDDDQSIYSWRGAEPHNILLFNEMFPNTKTIVLEQNYRSSSTIVRAASSVVANNVNRVDKGIWTANSSGDIISFRHEADPDLEALGVVDMIHNEQGLFDYHEIAIFYRTNSQSRVLEEKLRRQLIPYRIYGGVQFYERAEIKDVLAYLRLATNDSDNSSFDRIVNVPRRGIGEQTVKKIGELANENRLSMLQQCRELVKHNYPKLGHKLKTFVTEFDNLQQELLVAPLTEVLKIFLNHIDYFPYLDKRYRESSGDKRENVVELGTAINNFAQNYPEATLNEWLQSVALVGDEEETTGSKKNRISLMTLHASKGLEFNRVYIVGVEENILPHFNSIKEGGRPAIEEERRLFYVGMTRARERLSLSAARRREVFGSWNTNSPSRFLAEIPGQYLGGDNFAGKKNIPLSLHSSQPSPTP